MLLQQEKQMKKTSHIHTLGLLVFVVLWLETGSCCLAGLEPAM